MTVWTAGSSKILGLDHHERRRPQLVETESHWDHICLTITTCSFLTPTGESGPNQQCTQALLGEIA